MNEYTYTLLHIPSGRKFLCRVEVSGGIACLHTLLNAWNRADPGRWQYYSGFGESPKAIHHKIIGQSQPQLSLALEGK